MRSIVLLFAFCGAVAMPVAGQASTGVPSVSPDTVIRVAPMGEEPTVDGTISLGEEHGSSVQYGAISDETGLMAVRLCVFHVGYTDGGVYFAARTSVPEHPQTLTDDDTVSLSLLLPGATTTRTFTVRVSDGAGDLPTGAASASRILQGTRDYGVLCAETELFVPYSALGVAGFADGDSIGLQMFVSFSSTAEQARWHYSAAGDEMGTLVVDRHAPTPSLVNFYALEQWRSSSNYRLFFRYNNTGNDRAVRLSSSSVVHRGIGLAKLDDSPETDLEIVHEGISPLPASKKVAAGASEDAVSIVWTLWSGTVAILDVDISADGLPLFRRKIRWDLSVGRKWTCTSPSVTGAFFPCRTNLLRVLFTPAGVHDLTNATLQVVGVRSGTTFWDKSFKPDAYNGSFLMTQLPASLPEDDYEIRMTAFSRSGTTHSDTATFAVTNFPWQTANVGCARVIIPPYVPIKVENDEISFLQTGYRCSGVLWDAVYAQGENIMKGPVALKMNGKDFTVTGTRIVEQADDRVVREVTATCDGIGLVVTQDYDQDGFCDVKLRFSAGAGVEVRSLQVVAPLRDELARYFNVLNRGNDVRAGPAPDLRLPDGAGEVWNSSIGNDSAFTSTTYPACIQPYIWWGGIAKGFCWITDCVRDLSLDRAVPAERIVRADGAATLVCDFVNVPVTWTGEKTFEMGFLPTPTKPKEPRFGRTASRMYEYSCPSNALNVSVSWATFQYSWLHNPPNLYPGDDTSLRDWTYSQQVSDYGAYTVKLNEYLARNRQALEENPSTSPADYAQANVYGHRQMGIDLHICYLNPTLITSFWPEWEMYKSEWYPVAWPEDNYCNEYMGQVCKSRIDKLLWDGRNAIDGGAQGLYYDCFRSMGGEGLASENVYLKPNGYPQKQLSNVLEWRNVMKRSAVLCLQKGRTFCGRPVVELHDTSANVVPVMSFCLSSTSTERGSDGGDFQDRFPEAYTLVDVVGAASGKCTRFIVSTTMGDAARKERELESLMGYMCAYGLFSLVDQSLVKRDWFDRAWNRVFDYGWGTPEVKQICYWDDQPKPVLHGGRDVRLTVAQKADSALLMFGNLGEETDVSFNIRGLGFGAASLSDAETGEPLAEPCVRLRRHGYRMVLVSAPVEAAAGDDVLREGRDLAPYVPVTDGKVCLCPTDGVPFAVSFDTDLSDRAVWMQRNRPVRVEIADGASLTAQTIVLDGTDLPGVEFVGGSVRVPSADFRCSLWGSTYTTNRTIRFDGTDVSVGGYFWGVYGRDNLIALTNGASLTANSFVFAMPSDVAAVHTTNNVLFVSNGSRLTASAITLDRGGVPSAPTGNRAVVTGEGSHLGMKRTSYSYLYVGESTPGNSILFDDGATGYSGNLAVGYGRSAAGNLAVFRGRSAFTNEQDTFVGSAAGADSNRVEVLDGSALVQGRYNPVHVGRAGSYNELLVSNASVVCARIGLGDLADADHNRVTVVGPDSSIGGLSFVNQLFGFGRYNECVYDGCTLGDTTSFRTYFINDRVTGCAGTTNNVLRVVNGATLKSYDIILDRGCASNLVFVGSGSALRIGHDMKVRGLENTLVLSNASVNITRSGDNLRFGSVGDEDSPFEERGNRLVLQGRPRLYNDTYSTGFSFYDRSILEIDVPPEGYDAAHPVFDNVGFTADWNTRLVVRNLSRLRIRVRVATDFVLSSGDNFAVVNAPSGRSFADWLATAEGLTDGCALRMAQVEVGGVTAKRLVLHVEPAPDPEALVFDSYEAASNAAQSVEVPCPDAAVADVVGEDVVRYLGLFGVRVVTGGEPGVWTLAVELNSNAVEAVRTAFGTAKFDLTPAGRAPSATLKTEKGLYYGMAEAADLFGVPWTVSQWVLGDGGTKTVESAVPPSDANRAFFKLYVTRKP